MGDNILLITIGLVVAVVILAVVAFTLLVRNNPKQAKEIVIEVLNSKPILALIEVAGQSAPPTIVQSMLKWLEFSASVAQAQNQPDHAALWDAATSLLKVVTDGIPNETLPSLPEQRTPEALQKFLQDLKELLSRQKAIAPNG